MPCYYSASSAPALSVSFLTEEASDSWSLIFEGHEDQIEGIKQIGGEQKKSSLYFL